jgi:hypothetical protein
VVRAYVLRELSGFREFRDTIKVYRPFRFTGRPGLPAIKVYRLFRSTGCSGLLAIMVYRPPKFTGH